MRCPINVKCLLKNVIINFKLVTGADADVIPYLQYKKLCLDASEKTHTILMTFGQHKIVPLGTKNLWCKTQNSNEFKLIFYDRPIK